MKIEAIKLRFGNTPLHLGRGSDELDRTELIYHSDSLKSALYSAGISLFKQWEDPEYFFNGFKISSCFPFSADEYFLPKPYIRKDIVIEGSESVNMAKKIKKIEYLSKGVFEKYISSDSSEIILSENHFSADHAFICMNEHTCFRKKNGIDRRISIYNTEVQQRVAVPAMESGEDSRPFYIDRIYFEEDCGFYFLASFNDEAIRKQVLAALKILGDMGIGTDRTVGNGLFDFDEITDCSDFTFSISGNVGKQILLGLYLPTKDELEGIDLYLSRWSLLKRGGYMGGSNQDSFRHLRKKSIYMFGEGSVFSSEKKLEGKFEDLKPDWDELIHPVWRCGMPLIISI